MQRENVRLEPGSRLAFAGAAAGRHPSVAGLVKYFAWAHLPDAVRAASAPFGVLALELINMLPDSPELTVTLRKLLEAKDCACRAQVDAMLADATVPNAPEQELRP